MGRLEHRTISGSVAAALSVMATRAASCSDPLMAGVLSHLPPVVRACLVAWRGVRLIGLTVSGGEEDTSAACHLLFLSLLHVPCHIVTDFAFWKGFYVRFLQEDWNLVKTAFANFSHGRPKVTWILKKLSQ